MRQKLTPLSEWARREDIPHSTARKMVAEGRIRAQKIGDRWYVVEDIPEEAVKGGMVLTLFIHAGGAGKTSLARDLGFELASRGKRVLLVDMDPQANLSAWLGFEDVGERDTVLPVFEGADLPPPKEVYPNLDLIPSHVELARGEVSLSREPHNTFALRAALNGLREKYDYILVDSLPSLGSLAATAALAADGLVVPVELSRKGVQALGTVIGVAEAYGKALMRMRLWSGRSFVFLVVPTHAEGTARDREVLRLLQERLGDKVPVAPALSRRPAVYREAQTRGIPVQLVGSPEVVMELRGVADLVESLVRKRLEEVGV
ncbi:ParA family protein [Thermus sp. NEB1569]|uniref:ParA family protein n=1 Tax=Thermus sp. NEB1569 TaxID=2918899 RepID=UPI001EFBCAA0|nr:ParA family protein [Thermus sp. NEB1569]ULR39714.1 ParA family protein [Thermus sp. NEB1569]